MTQQIINVGNAPNDGEGDPIRTAFIKSNDNFTQLYQRVQTVPPTSFYGKVGDQPGMYAYDPIYFYYCFAAYDGINPIWAEIAQAGNVSATQLLYGNSNVTIGSPGSNITIGVNGTSNVAKFTSSGLTVANTITGNSLTISANISAVGNISGTYFLGNGALLSGIPATYSNANVESYLPTYTGTLAPSAIYTNNYFYANGDPFISGSNYSNANVAAFLPTYSGNLSASNVLITNTVSVQGNVNVAGNVDGNLNGTTNGIHNGLVFSINILDLSWDFGYITANTYTNPIQYLFAATGAGNIDMGTITAPSSLAIDIGTISF
jgi:hypothetical protein